MRASLKALQLGKLCQPARPGKQRYAAVSGPNPPCLLPSPSLCSGLSPDCSLVMAGLFQFILFLASVRLSDVMNGRCNAAIARNDKCCTRQALK